MKNPGAIWASLARDAALDPLGLVHFGCTDEFVLRCCRARLCYLATPFTKVARHKYGGLYVRGAELAARAAEHHVMRLAKLGVTAISPVSGSWRACQAMPDAADPLDAEFWEMWCRPLLARASAVIVPDIAGWDQSEGVAFEARWAVEKNMSVFVMGRVA